VAREIYDRAAEPKQLLELSGGHYDVYDVPSVREACVNATTRFLVKHL
jgi:hypothetical protein